MAAISPEMMKRLREGWIEKEPEPRLDGLTGWNKLLEESRAKKRAATTARKGSESDSPRATATERLLHFEEWRTCALKVEHEELICRIKEIEKELYKRPTPGADVANRIFGKAEPLPKPTDLPAVATEETGTW